MAVRRYVAIVERAAEGFGVFFPDLPGCTSAGVTLQEAALNAEEALQGHVEASAEHGHALPEPSALDTVAIDPEVEEAARLLVRFELPSEVARADVAVP